MQIRLLVHWRGSDIHKRLLARKTDIVGIFNKTQHTLDSAMVDIFNICGGDMKHINIYQKHRRSGYIKQRNIYLKQVPWQTYTTKKHPLETQAWQVYKTKEHLLGTRCRWKIITWDLQVNTSAVSVKLIWIKAEKPRAKIREVTSQTPKKKYLSLSSRKKKRSTHQPVEGEKE